MIDALQHELVPPRSWDQFEELCADTFAAEWGDPTLVRHGRSGQRQNGVDIVSRHGANYPIGLQCKKKSRWPVKALSKVDVDAEIAKAEKFRPKLKTFYILSTAPDDAKLQAHVRSTNERRVAAGNFNVVVLGWSEIVRRASLHAQVASKHFGGFGTGPREPLLATWRCCDEKLELKGEELQTACRELAHEFDANPSGRIVLRQVESDELAEKIAVFGGKTLTLTERKKRLKLLDQLKRKEDTEAHIAKGVRLMLAEPAVSSWVLKVHTASGLLSQTITAFVNFELDPDRAIIAPGTTRLRVTSPRDKDIRQSRYMNKGQAASVMALMQERVKKYGRPLTETVDELPERIRAKFAIPAVISEILRLLDEGRSIHELQAGGFLDIGQWRIELG